MCGGVTGGGTVNLKHYITNSHRASSSSLPPSLSGCPQLPQLLRPGGIYSFFNGLAPDNIFFHMVRVGGGRGRVGGGGGAVGKERGMPPLLPVSVPPSPSYLLGLFQAGEDRALKAGPLHHLHPDQYRGCAGPRGVGGRQEQVSPSGHTHLCETRAWEGIANK